MNFKTTCFGATFVAFVLCGCGQALAEEVPADIPSAFDLLNIDPVEEARDRAAMRERVLEKGGFFPSLGNWFDQANPGWGFDIQAVGNNLFAVWFTYNPDGTPTWYIIVGQLAAKGDGMSLTGNIDSFTWDFNTQSFDSSVVGTMNIVWADENNAKAVWTLNGEDGLAGISFVPFAPGMAFSDMTGHYFQTVAPGWGFTLLTQGDVTVLTMYWYKDGLPVWAQGVLPLPDFYNGFWTLNYFFGPGLCPSCLDDKSGPAAKFEAKPLVTVRTRFGGPGNPSHTEIGNPSDVSIEWAGTVGDQLGTSPFSDIFALTIQPVGTTSVTSVVMDNFDPNYTEFGQLLAEYELGTCLAFQYDPGIFTNVLTGSFETAYFMVAPTSFNGLPVYSNAGCTTPFPFPYDIDGISQLWGAPTGPGVNDGGVIVTPIQVAWGGERFGFSGGAGDCFTTDRVFFSGARWAGPDDLTMRFYGFTRAHTDVCETGLRLHSTVGGHLDPPPGVDITDGLLDRQSIFATY